MEELIKQIKISLDNNLYLLGLYTCLTIPDICGAVDTKNGIANGQKYRDWYKKYVFSNYSYFPYKNLNFVVIPDNKPSLS